MFIFVYIVCNVVYFQMFVQGMPVEKNVQHIDVKAKHDEVLQREIFLIPARLKREFSIRIMGTLPESDLKRLTFSLTTRHKKENMPDYENVACRLQADFIEDRIIINNVKEGTIFYESETDATASGLFRDKNFTVVFQVHSRYDNIDLMIGASTTDSSCEMQNHDLDEISYLTVEGNIEEITRIDFLFRSVEYFNKMNVAIQ